MTPVASAVLREFSAMASATVVMLRFRIIITLVYIFDTLILLLLRGTSTDVMLQAYDDVFSF